MDADSMSKSAKKRAAKKARDAAHEEAAAAPPPPPAAKAGAKAKAKAADQSLPLPPQPKAAAKGKAKAAPAPAEPEPKAKAKGKAKAQPEPPAPEPKAKGKAQAAPKAEPKAEPAPKAQGKKKAKKPEAEEVKAQAPAQTGDYANFVIDDGSGPAWEEAAGISKKLEKRKAKVAEQAAQPQAANGKPVVQQQVVGASKGKGASKGSSGPSGPSQSVAADVARILAMKIEAPAATTEEKAAPAANLSTATVSVPEKKIGVVIGPGGKNIKLLQEKTGVSRIDTAGQLFTISGEDADAVAQCETAIKDLANKGYCALMFDGFSENIISVNSSALPSLIGEKGCIIRKIKESLNVEINIEDSGKGAAASKKAKVTLAGSPDSVEKAKNTINNIVLFGHDEVTHPGLVHEEMDVEERQYRFIIGKGGSEMKHIQHNWNVKVNIPREGSTNDKVLIVGEREQVERAKAYIEKVIWNAEDAAKGREREDKADDGLGEKEEEEPWMKPFMYKR